MPLRALLAIALGPALLAAGCAPHAGRLPGSLPAKARYVAMGSSFAAGSGIMPSADTPANRCGRSASNYAHLLAARRDLRLVDVSCGGATTAHLLGPWGELPPQLDAVTPDTALVTITIGGNDVGFIGGLIAASCADPAGNAADGDTATMCRAIRARSAASDPAARSRALGRPDEAAWQALAVNMQAIGARIRATAPVARIVFVDYLTVLPSGAGCREAPLAPEAAAHARQTAARLAQVTREAARSAGAELVRASSLSQNHDACAPEPWSSGFLPREGKPRSVAYHPNVDGMRAIAVELDRLLR